MPSKPPLRITSVARGPFDAVIGVSEGVLCPRGSDIATAVSAAVELRLSKAHPCRGGSEPAVEQGGQGHPDAILVLQAALGDRHARTVGSLCEDQAPRVDDERAAVARARLVVAATLCRSEHERLVFDRTGAKQDLPVILACVGCKGAGNREPPCAP